MTCIIKEPSEGELVEAVVVSVVVLIRCHLVLRPQFIGVDGVEVAGVQLVFDLRFVRRGVVSDVTTEVNAAEEVVIPDLVATILAQSLLFTGAEGENQGFRLFTQPRVSRNPQMIVPLDNLKKISMKYF